MPINIRYDVSAGAGAASGFMGGRENRRRFDEQQAIQRAQLVQQARARRDAQRLAQEQMKARERMASAEQQAELAKEGRVEARGIATDKRRAALDVEKFKAEDIIKQAADVVAEGRKREVAAGQDALSLADLAVKDAKTAYADALKRFGPDSTGVREMGKVLQEMKTLRSNTRAKPQTMLDGILEAQQKMQDEMPDQSEEITPQKKVKGNMIPVVDPDTGQPFDGGYLQPDGKVDWELLEQHNEMKKYKATEQKKIQDAEIKKQEATKKSAMDTYLKYVEQKKKMWEEARSRAAARMTATPDRRNPTGKGAKPVPDYDAVEKEFVEVRKEYERQGLLPQDFDEVMEGKGMLPEQATPAPVETPQPVQPVEQQSEEITAPAPAPTAEKMPSLSSDLTPEVKKELQRAYDSAMAYTKAYKLNNIKPVPPKDLKAAMDFEYVPTEKSKKDRERTFGRSKEDMKWTAALGGELQAILDLLHNGQLIKDPTELPPDLFARYHELKYLLRMPSRKRK